MHHPMLRRATPAIVAVLVAITGGVVGGTTATSGLRLNSYGIDASPPKPFETAQLDQVQPSKAGCTDCSERAPDYHWATARAIRSAIDCPADRWNFERGCRDYAREPAT